MPQLKLSRRLVSVIQTWASVVLIVLAFIFSLMPIITIKTPDIADGVGDMIAKMGVTVDEDMQQMLESENIEISPLKLASSVGLVFRIAGAAADESGEGGKELESYLKSEEGRQDVLVAASIAFSMVNLVDMDNLAGVNIISVIFNILISVIGFFGTLILTLIIPISLFIKAVSALVCVARGFNNPESIAAHLGSKLSGFISLPLVFMLLQCVVPGMTYGYGIVAVCLLSVFSVLVNLLASRAHAYQPEQLKYLNILQGGAVVGIAGFMVFFFNIINTGIFKAFSGGYFPGYLSAVLTLSQNESAAVQSGYLIDAALMLVYLILVLSCTSYLERAVRRLSCTVRKEKPAGLIGLFFRAGIYDNSIARACLMLGAYLIPTIVSSSKHYYENPLSAEAVGDASFLEAADFNGAALSGALVGIVIMILTEVAVVVLRRRLVKLSESEREQLLIGQVREPLNTPSESKASVAPANAQGAEGEDGAQSLADDFIQV